MSATMSKATIEAHLETLRKQEDTIDRVYEMKKSILQEEISKYEARLNKFPSARKAA